jgi:hypothetical protein
VNINQSPETEEQQKKVRIAMNKAMKINAQSQTNFNNAWRKKLEKKINR